MFDLSLPWWEFVLRTTVVYALLLVMVRVSGHRTVGQFTPFDLLVVMLLSESVTESLTGGDESLVGGLIAAATLIALNLLVATLASHSREMEDIFDGKAVVIGRDGRFFDKVVKHHRLTQSDLDESLRENDVELHEMRCAFLEADGTITVLKKKQK